MPTDTPLQEDALFLGIHHTHIETYRNPLCSSLASHPDGKTQKCCRPSSSRLDHWSNRQGAEAFIDNRQHLYWLLSSQSCSPHCRSIPTSHGRQYGSGGLW